MKKVFNILLASIMIITSIFCLVTQLGAVKYTRLICFISIILLVPFPLVFKNTKLKFNELEYLLYLIFIFLADFLGCCVNLYKTTQYFDLFTHFISGIYSVLVGIKLYTAMDKYNKKETLFNLMLLMSFTFLIAGCWEIFEFLGDRLLDLDLQRAKDSGVVDTMEDIIAAGLGGLLSYSICFAHYKKIDKLSKK